MTEKAASAALFVVTSPYYLLFDRSTRQPLLEIIQNPDPNEAKKRIKAWLRWKHREATYVQVAGAVVFTSVISVLSWPGFQDRHWVAAASFYSSVLLALTSVVSGAQQTILIEGVTDGGSFRGEEPAHWGAARPSSMKMLMWQLPLMFLSYSIALFLVGLFAWVISPVASKLEFDADAKIMIFFLAFALVSAVLFVVASKRLHTTMSA